ncbi:hypothetical protein [Psychrosphaera algicola]|uniref:Uncharacterized protein n=2 Tax=Psychrosphaera TaxID=907197 RepID=A0ABT5FBR3_9GAMM|nr:hypothetical protein [Psychrosphaera sp. G1-22]MDC2888985.1 hypothetical protein [Psychrosphaera sp. G1-22]
MVNGILGDNEKFYLIHGQAFWVKNGLFESMYLTTPREVPKVWRDIGFSWYLSYTQIYNLFECLGFEVNVNIEPQNEIFKGKESFKARLTAVNSLRNLKVTLNFLYGIGKDFNSENTLYSMKFVPIKKKGI